MLDILSRYWWAYIVRGIAGILFSILAYAWPRITLATLIILFGAYAFVDGIFLIIKTIGNWGDREDRWLILLQGLLGIGVGIMTLVAPGITAIRLVLYIAAWSLATGVLEIVAAIRLRKEIQGEGWMILSGIVSILFCPFADGFSGCRSSWSNLADRSLRDHLRHAAHRPGVQTSRPPRTRAPGKEIIHRLGATQSSKGGRDNWGLHRDQQPGA